MVLAVSTLLGCSKVGNGLRFQIRDNQASWMNGTVRFQADMDSKGKRQDYPGFQVYIKNLKGRIIHMPGSEILGYGASCPMGSSGLYNYTDGFSQAELLINTDDRMVVLLHHDPWTILDESVYFDKQITLFRDSPIMSVIDYYKGSFEMLNVAAGLSSSDAVSVNRLEKGYSVEYSNGVTGIIIMPDLEEMRNNEAMSSVFVTKGVSFDEPLRYYVGLSDKGLGFLLEELDKIL